MAPTVAPKAACTDGARHGTTRRAARVAVCPLVPCRGQGRSAMAGGTRHIGFYYAATRARMTPAVAAKDACTRGAMGTTVRCPPVVPGPLARGSHCPPCPRPWKPPWFPMLAGGPQFASSPFDTSEIAAASLRHLQPISCSGSSCQHVLLEDTTREREMVSWSNSTDTQRRWQATQAPTNSQT